MAIRIRPAVTRRHLLATGVAATALTTIGGIARPFISRANNRPLITHGIQSGDVSVDSGVIWARADRPSRMLVEIATTESFKDARNAAFVDALPETDFTAKLLLENLPPAQEIFYRVRFQDLASPTIVGEAQVGRFRTAPNDRRSISFVWSGDTAGQGWGIDESRGGMRTYATMLKSRPDFFVHNGDTIYADGPIAAEQKMPNGEAWRNIVSEDKSKAAETLQEFRGNYKYNLLDKNLRAFNVEVPIFTQWDDHEVTNNWWPGEPLTRAEHQRRRKRTQRCFRRGRRARSMNTCRCAGRRLSRVVSIARFPTVPCSMSSCSTCAAIAGPTVKARKIPTAPLPISLVQHKSPG
jgi:alkaline phosphatase D